MRLGFVGTGAITSAIVTGLNAAGAGDDTILVSPRNADNAAALTARFRNVTIAASNQAVLDGSDVVMLAVRPQVADEVLSALTFRRDHHVISLMTIVPLEKVSALVAPATKIVRAIPLPMVADLRGPTAIYPQDSVASGIFNRIGTAIAAETADQFNAIGVATATMSPYFSFAGTIIEWLVRHDVPADAARRYVSTVFQGLADIAVRHPDQSFATLAAEFATRGGINEQVAAHLKQTGALTSLSDALDAVLERMKKAAR